MLNRVNTLTGVAYKDDPTVMTWELGNEPRCLRPGVYPRSPNCTTQTLVDWADEMTRHIKSVDRKHLVGVGDEGFFCDDPASDRLDAQLRRGRRHARVHPAARGRRDVVPPLPGRLGQGRRLGTDWITRHVQRGQADRQAVDARASSAGATRPPATRSTSSGPTPFDSAGGDGLLYWILSGVQDDGTLYPDYDGFTVYCPSPVCTTMTNAGDELRTGSAVLPAGRRPRHARSPSSTQPVTLSPAANDIAYRTHVQADQHRPRPGHGRQQTTVTVAGGTFTLAAAGAVTFTPAAGFAGRATATLHGPRRGRPDVQRGRR